TAVHLAWLAAGPVPELRAGGAGVDPQFARQHAFLIFGRGRGDGDLALAVAVEVCERRHDGSERAERIRAGPVTELLAARRRQYRCAAAPDAVGVRRIRRADEQVGAPVGVDVVKPRDEPPERPRRRVVRAQYTPVLAAHEVNAPGLGRRTDEDV